MELQHIGILIAAAFVYGLLVPGRLRGWILMIASVFAIYWLQPALPVRFVDFALPSLTIALALLVWFLTQSASIKREDWIALALAFGTVLALALTRYLVPELRPTPSRAPPAMLVIAGMLIALVSITLFWQLSRFWKGMLSLAILGLIIIFVFIKAETLTLEIATLFRDLGGYDPDLASVTDIQWLGFSYVAFRLIHVLRDRQTGKLPEISLRDHLTYIIFFPAYTAGPIDRAEHFAPEMQQLPTIQILEAPRWTIGLGRIASGLFKKFVFADLLALIALDVVSADQISSAGDAWVLLYAYAFRLYLDFSGYTDIAIGLGILFGILLPENFNRPYLKNNITAFWQSWHMTLSNWVRFYVFSPLSRSMLRWNRRPSTNIIILISHVATMVIIGLWHGITINFVIWGLWHAIGLFIHKVWSDNTRPYYLQLRDRPRLKNVWTVTGVLLTFHFVALGWVWFALPEFEMARDVFLQLFGIN